MAIKDELGEDGFDIWDAWGSKGDGYKASTARSVWKSFKKSGVGIGTLFFRAQKAGWKNDFKDKKYTAEEMAQRAALRAARLAAEAEQEAILAAAAAARAVAILAKSAPAPDDHPYLVRKGVSSHGLRVGAWEWVDGATGEVHSSPGHLIIPLCDRQKKVHSLQFIDPTGKNKRYLADGAKQGHFFAIGTARKHAGQPVFVLAEGYATAATVSEATGHLVLTCFDAGNLLPVAQAIRARLPDAILMVAADNDVWTKGNPGMTAARRVAQAVGALVCAPPFGPADEAGRDDKDQPFGPSDWNDWALESGAQSLSDAFESALAGDPAPDAIEPEPAPAPAAPPAPVQPAPVISPSPPIGEGEPDDAHAAGHFAILGYDGDKYYFFHHAKRQVLARSKGDLTDMGFVELAPRQWWEYHFPKPSGTGFDKLAAAEWIFALAHARGIYSTRRIRGRGAWHDKGRQVFHHGDRLTVDGVDTPIAKVVSGYVYPMAAPMPELRHPPMTDAEGQHLLDIAKMIRWCKPASAALLVGWTFLAPICGALSWRPHIWITGPAGSGKSYVVEHFAARLITGIGEYMMGNSSEPGIRQRLGSDAVPVVLDEFEPNDDKDRQRIANILTLIRQSSSESGAQTVKGTVAGDGMSFHIRSMFCVAAISTMLDKDSDSSRITPLVIRAAAKSGDADDNWGKLEDALHAIEKDSTWPARMLARSLGMQDVVLENAKVFSKVGAVRFGTQRAGDQFGTLMAGAWCAISSKVATEAEAAAMFASYNWSEHKEEGQPDDPIKALGAILEAKVRVSNMDVTIFEMIQEAAERNVKQLLGGTASAEALARVGMRVVKSELVFGCSSAALRALVSKTAYFSDLRGQLLRIPGANRFNNKTLKFSGVDSKCVAIPLAGLFDDDELPI